MQKKHHSKAPKPQTTSNNVLQNCNSAHFLYNSLVFVLKCIYLVENRGEHCLTTKCIFRCTESACHCFRDLCHVPSHPSLFRLFFIFLLHYFLVITVIIIIVNIMMIAIVHVGRKSSGSTCDTQNAFTICTSVIRRMPMPLSSPDRVTE